MIQLQTRILSEGELRKKSQTEWPGFDLLAAARDYPARHGAILLPFDAAVAALGEQAAPA